MPVSKSDLGPVAALPTPALLVDADGLTHNLAAMAAALPGDRLRPHVKAHKCTELARAQAQAQARQGDQAHQGRQHQQSRPAHQGFCCATVREMEGMARAGLGADLLLANEVLDARRLTPLLEAGARVTVAVDSPETIEAASRAGIPEVLIDVNVGLPRCGCDPADAGRLADLARSRGREVRGVMGYEGHVVGLENRADRERRGAAAMELLSAAATDVGGDVVSAGGTGTYDSNAVATEIQAGSYALMDTAYARLGLPFVNALTIAATVISVNRAGWAVADCGLKALGMDHGDPSIAGGASVWFCSDEHITFAPEPGQPLPRVGDRIEVVPAHVDPTVAYHEHLHVVDPFHERVVDRWPVDLRGW